MWNLAEDGKGWGKVIDDLACHGHVFAIATTPDGNYLTAAGLGGFTVWKRDGQSRWKRMHEQLDGGRRCVAAAPDSRTLALGGMDRTVRLWDIKLGKQTKVFTGLADDVRSVGFSPDGMFLAASTFGGEFRLWKLVPDSHPVPIHGRIDSVQAFRFTPDNRTLALARWGDHGKDLVLWDYRRGTEPRHLASNDTGVNDLAVSPDGCILASANRDGSIRFWDLLTGQLKATVIDGVGWVKTLAYVARRTGDCIWRPERGGPVPSPRPPLHSPGCR